MHILQIKDLGEYKTFGILPIFRRLTLFFLDEYSLSLFIEHLLRASHSAWGHRRMRNIPYFRGSPS